MRGPNGGAAGRGAYGAQVTTANGRTFTDVGRAGGAVGPNGGAVGGRSNTAVASGPNGTVASRSAGVAGVGANGGSFAAGSRGVAGVGANGAFAAGSRGAVGVGANGGAFAAGSRGVAGVGAAGYGAAGYHGASAYRPYGYNAYGAYHSGWVHGYWNGHNDAAWGWRGGYWGAWGLGAGIGLGWGLANWGFGSSLYGLGYATYANPYYYADPGVAAVASGPAPYDYSQPIDTTSPPSDEATANPAMALFDQARGSFQQGDYAGALQQTNQALAKLPNDTTLHEFRALCLFALGRYDESASTLYAVLSVGPGWDWTTMIGLYPSVDVYTTQLRALEDYCNAHADSATARFVLAYQYLTQGHNDAAVAILKQVVALKPSDTLSAGLLKQLSPPPDQAAGSTAAAPAPAPEAAPAAAPAAEPAPPAGATIAGAWKASPAPDTSIVLTIQADGKFTWQVTQKGKARQFGGSSTFGDGILTLAQDAGPALVGHVAWTDASHMNFKIAGDGPGDPGLNFSK
ncbi:MAG: hypothetical protein U0835_22075 [Isosphaeraceae bacterium]